MRRLPDLIGFVAAGLVVGVVAMLLLDGAFALLGAGRFGQINGWLALVLPVWLFVEEFRAWRRSSASLASVMLAALAAAIFAFAAGMVCVGLLGEVAEGVEAVPLIAGGVGALIGAVGYAVAWFYGVRWVTGSGGAGSRPADRDSRTGK